MDADVLGILSTTPQRVKNLQGDEVQARSAADAILLDQYTNAKAAAASGSLRCRIVGQIVGPGGISPTPGQTPTAADFGDSI